MKTRRAFIQQATGMLAVPPIASFVNAAASPGSYASSGAAPPTTPEPGPVVAPRWEEITGRIGPVIQIPDGRFLAVYPEGRRTKEWDNTSIPEYMYGRFSPDGLGQWSERQVLFTFPPGPGAAGMGITSGGALPLVSR